MAARTRRSQKANGPHGLAVAARIKDARLIAGISQSALAEALGVSFQQVQKYESGLNRISSDRLHVLAKTLNLPITYFYSDAAPLTVADNEIVSSLVRWMDKDPAARQILTRLPTLKHSDVVLLSALVERMD